MPPSPDTSKRKVFRLLWFGVLLIGIAARLTLLNAGLEYDEIWTLCNFAPLPLSRIFTDLALPNNHPLNTLGVKLCASLFSPPWTIRLPALLAGIGSLLLMPLIAFLWSRRRITAWIATLIFALCHPAFLYAQQARGYSLQLFFLMLFAAGFLLAGKFRPRHHRFLPETLVFFGGAGSILTLPTSILYLGVITLIGYFLCRKLPLSRLPLRRVLIVGVVLTFLWYGMNYQALQAARVWGIPVTGIRQFLQILSDSMLQLNGPAVLLLALAGVVFRFRRAWPLLIFYLAVFGSAFATNAGAARVYLPLTVPTAILAGMGAEAIFRRLKTRFPQPRPWLAPVLTLPLAALLIWNWCCGARCWHVQEWFQLYREITELPPEKLFLLDASAGYPYAWNNQPRATEDYRRRLDDRTRERELLSFLPPGILQGVDADGAGRALSLRDAAPESEVVQIAGMPAVRYRLQRLDGTPKAGYDLVLVLRGWPLPELVQGIRRIRAAFPETLLLNPCLNLPGMFLQAAALALHCDDPAQLDWEPLRNRFTGTLDIYRILPGEEKKSGK